MAARRTVSPALGAPAAPGTTAIAPLGAGWEERLSSLAARDAEGTRVAEWPYMSLRNGVLTWQQQQLESSLEVVVLGGTMLNIYYDAPFNPAQQQRNAAACWALGLDAAQGLAPARPGTPGAPPKPQAESCGVCWANAFGTGRRPDGSASRGKACANRQRVALLPSLDDGEDWATVPGAMLMLPVTSVAAYSTFVSLVTRGMKRPLCTVIARLSVIPDPRRQFVVTWEPVRSVAARDVEALLRRAEEARPALAAQPSADGVAPETTSAPPPSHGARVRRPVAAPPTVGGPPPKRR